MKTEMNENIKNLFGLREICETKIRHGFYVKPEPSKEALASVERSFGAEFIGAAAAMFEDKSGPLTDEQKILVEIMVQSHMCGGDDAVALKEMDVKAATKFADEKIAARIEKFEQSRARKPSVDGPRRNQAFAEPLAAKAW